jgi:hypothetical protein
VTGFTGSTYSRSGKIFFPLWDMKNPFLKTTPEISLYSFTYVYTNTSTGVTAVEIELDRTNIPNWQQLRKEMFAGVISAVANGNSQNTSQFMITTLTINNYDHENGILTVTAPGAIAGATRTFTMFAIVW